MVRARSTSIGTESHLCLGHANPEFSRSFVQIKARNPSGLTAGAMFRRRLFARGMNSLGGLSRIVDVSRAYRCQAGRISGNDPVHW